MVYRCASFDDRFTYDWNSNLCGTVAVRAAAICHFYPNNYSYCNAYSDIYPNRYEYSNSHENSYSLANTDIHVHTHLDAHADSNSQFYTLSHNYTFYYSNAYPKSYRSVFSSSYLIRQFPWWRNTCGTPTDETIRVVAADADQVV